MAQNVTLLGASYSDVPAVTLPKTGGGTASFTDVTPTTVTSDSDVANGKIYFRADGSQHIGTASGGAKYTATITPRSGRANVCVQYDNTDYYTLNDTFTYSAGDTLRAICSSALYTFVYVDDVLVAQDFKSDKTASVTYDYTLPAGNITIDLSASNTSTRSVKIYTYPPLITKGITENGTYNASDENAVGYSSVTVNVSGGGGGESKNAQVVQGSSRTTSSSPTAIGPEMTVTKTGIYNVYWSAFRSSTSGTYLYGTQLYIDDTPYSSENTTWTNNVQNNYKSGISLTANQKIRVYGRCSRDSTYYIYAPILVIIEV